MLDHQGAAGILPKLSDERKRGEAFPTIKISEQNETISLDVVPSVIATCFFSHMQPLQFPDMRPSAHAQAGPIKCPGNHWIGPENLFMAYPADAPAPWSDQ